MTAPLAWHRWIGLPHQVGADPEDGQGACCLLVAKRLLEAADEVPPPVSPAWYDWATEGDTARIREEFERLTLRLTGPEPWALVPFWGPPFGLGVVLDDCQLLLIPHHRRGVQAIPLRAFPTATFHRVRP